MDSVGDILRHMSAIASSLAPVAIAWHAAIAAAVVALFAGWRPDLRAAWLLLALPPLSVAYSAYAFGDAPRAVSFGALSLLFALAGPHKTEARVHLATPGNAAVGGTLVLFALCYPAFVHGALAFRLVAAPVGVLPAPTLALVAGALLAGGGRGSRARCGALAVWTAAYAYIGIAQLGVALDVALVIATFGLAAIATATTAPTQGALQPRTP
jgi:hypothetical protein